MKLAVVGKDVSKSLSPQMHAFILGALGETCVYDKISIPPAEFSARAEELLNTYDGLNITIPFKTEILPFLKTLHGDARAFGAVNTVLCAERAGYNTDGAGFKLMLENAGVDVRDKKVLVLGVGGAGRSCVRTLAKSGANVYAYGRTFSTVERAYAELGGFTPLKEIPQTAFDIIVNCTGVGMHDTEGESPTVTFEGGKAEPVGENLLRDCETAVDLIYEPTQSEFLKRAAALGKKTVNGEAMLFYQAVVADGHFLDRDITGAAERLYRQYREERK